MSSSVKHSLYSPLQMGGHGHGGPGHHHENITIDWDSIKWDELTPEEKWNYEHLRMHQKHAGLQ